MYSVPHALIRARRRADRSVPTWLVQAEYRVLTSSIQRRTDGASGTASSMGIPGRIPTLSPDA